MSTENNELLMLSDSAIAQISMCLQLAILTGTDVVDNLRLLKLTSHEGLLVPSQEYLEQFEVNLAKMQEEANEMPKVKLANLSSTDNDNHD